MVVAVLLLAVLAACARRLRRRGMQRLVEGSAAEGALRAAPWRDVWCASSADLEALRTCTERGGLREAAAARRAARSGGPGGIDAAATELGALQSDPSCALRPREGSTAARHLAMTRGAARDALGSSDGGGCFCSGTGTGSWAGAGGGGGAGCAPCSGESMTAERLRRIREQRGGQRLAASRAQLERLRAQTAHMVAAQLDEEHGGGSGGVGGCGATLPSPSASSRSYEGHGEVACEGWNHPLTPPKRGSWRAVASDDGGGGDASGDDSMR